MWAAVGAALVTTVARGPTWRKALALGASGALLAACIVAERWMALAFAHAHNFIAIALWWALRPRSKELAPLLLFAVACAALLSGVLDPAVDALGLPRIGASMHYHEHVLAPRLDAVMASRVVVLFAFAQAVHYVVWLRLIPEDARERTAPRSFASSWRALASDLGPWVLGVFVLAAIGLGAWAFVDLARARAGYLRVAVVHGHLEVIAAAFFLVEGVPGRSAR